MPQYTLEIVNQRFTEFANFIDMQIAINNTFNIEKPYSDLLNTIWELNLLANTNTLENAEKYANDLQAIMDTKKQLVIDELFAMPKGERDNEGVYIMHTLINHAAGIKFAIRYTIKDAKQPIEADHLIDEME